MEMTKKQTTTLSIMILIIIALTVLVSRQLWFRLDLTKGKTYTISEVSRNLYHEISDQIRITYYLSDKLKSIHPLPGEIEDLLREYAGFSRGKIQLTVRDPAKANLTNHVEQLGILPQQINTQEQDQASVMIVYTGIVIEYLDQFEVLPVVFSLETLEYDLTSRIRAMVRGNTRMLGVIAGDDPMRWNDYYRYLQNFFMQAGYQLRLIDAGGDIAETIPALLVLGGTENLDEAALYQIDRYIQNGGKVLFTVKSVNIDTEGGTLEARMMEDRGLLTMLSSYGVTILPEIVMDKSANNWTYQTRNPNGFVITYQTIYPQWVRVKSENGNPSHPVSAHFGGLDLYWANPIELNTRGEVEAEYLFTSTDQAWTLREPFHTNPGVPYLFERDAAETKGVKILGASLSGIFPSWFAGRPKPQRDDPEFGSAEPDSGELPDMPLHAKTARIIVAGETDFVTALPFSIRPPGNGQANLEFLIQAADWLCNDDDIIGIRSREYGSGRLDKIFDPEKKAAAEKLTKIVNVYLVPALVIIAGIFLAIRRRHQALLMAGTKAKSPAANQADSTKERSDDV
jgi:gliding-associated putative ABC transporter substrate-binding component GldG